MSFFNGIMGRELSQEIKTITKIWTFIRNKFESSLRCKPIMNEMTETSPSSRGDSSKWEGSYLKNNRDCSLYWRNDDLLIVPQKNFWSNLLLHQNQTINPGVLRNFFLWPIRNLYAENNTKYAVQTNFWVHSEPPVVLFLTNTYTWYWKIAFTKNRIESKTYKEASFIWRKYPNMYKML